MKIKFLQSTASTFLLSCVLTHSVLGMDDEPFPKNTSQTPKETPSKPTWETKIPISLKKSSALKKSKLENNLLSLLLFQNQKFDEVAVCEELIQHPDFNSKPFDVVYDVHAKVNECIIECRNIFLKNAQRLGPFAKSIDEFIQSPRFKEQEDIPRYHILTYAIVYRTLIKNNQRSVELYEELIKNPEFENKSPDCQFVFLRSLLDHCQKIKKFERVIELCGNITSMPIFNTLPKEWQEDILSLNEKALDELSQ